MEEKRKLSKDEIARGLIQLYNRLKKGDDGHVFSGFAFAGEMTALYEAIGILETESNEKE